MGRMALALYPREGAAIRGSLLRSSPVAAKACGRNRNSDTELAIGVARLEGLVRRRVAYVTNKGHAQRLCQALCQLLRALLRGGAKQDLFMLTFQAFHRQSHFMVVAEGITWRPKEGGHDASLLRAAEIRP